MTMNFMTRWWPGSTSGRRGSEHSSPGSQKRRIKEQVKMVARPRNQFYRLFAKAALLGRLFRLCGHREDTGDIAVEVNGKRLPAFMLCWGEHNLVDKVPHQCRRFGPAILIGERFALQQIRTPDPKQAFTLERQVGSNAGRSCHPSKISEVRFGLDCCLWGYVKNVPESDIDPVST